MITMQWYENSDDDQDTRNWKIYFRVRYTWKVELVR